MLNIKTIIISHNNKLLQKESSQQSKPCNFKNKDTCPLKGSCRQQSVNYQADIFHGNLTESYVIAAKQNLNPDTTIVLNC